MSLSLIKSIQDDTDLRLIVPFGLTLQMGDVISVSPDGEFTLQGNVKSLLGASTGRSRAGNPVDMSWSSGNNVEVAFHAGGKASTVFPDLPAASARLEVSFGSAKSWLLAMRGRKLRSLENLDRFRVPILDAYRRGVWKPDWALVTTVGEASRMTLLAARSRNTKVALSLGAKVAANAGLKAQLTAGVSIAAANQQITQCITSRRTAVSCGALRVRDPWWRSPYVTDLAEVAAPSEDPIKADRDEFWEDVDAL